MDETCIDCDTCRWMQSDTFVHKDGKSAVVRQPETEVRTGPRPRSCKRRILSGLKC